MKKLLLGAGTLVAAVAPVAAVVACGKDDNQVVFGKTKEEVKTYLENTYKVSIADGTDLSALVNAQVIGQATHIDGDSAGTGHIKTETVFTTGGSKGQFIWVHTADRTAATYGDASGIGTSAGAWNVEAKQTDSLEHNWDGYTGDNLGNANILIFIQGGKLQVFKVYNVGELKIASQTPFIDADITAPK